MQNVRLLLVDDDEFIHRVVPSVLEPMFGSSLQIVHALSPEAALLALEALPAGRVVVLCDYDLKAGMDGIELLSRIAGVRPDSVRILFSGHAREAFGQRLLSAPIHAFFEKPLRLQELAEPLAVVVDAVAPADRSVVS